MHAAIMSAVLTQNRYFSQSILDSIHRGIAIDIWAGVRDTDGAHGDRQLEQSLAAFDMFVLHDQEGDADEVSKRAYTLF